MINKRDKKCYSVIHNMYKAVSLFASGGIGDLALVSNNIDVIVANELLEDRGSLFRYNYPKTNMIVGDIWALQDKIISETKKSLKGEELDFFLATPSCQGMSKNGQCKLLKLIREGKRLPVDPRNRLIIPTLNIAIALHPKTIVFENVPEMENTIIDDENGDYVNIIDYIKKRLGSEYSGTAEVVEFADYGVPQRRKRLITVFTRENGLKKYYQENQALVPPRTHNKSGSLKPWVTVRDTIGKLKPLDAKNKESSKDPENEYHWVPVLDPKKYIWISNTPKEKGAFDNQCINKDCLYQGNTTHGSENGSGINKSKTTTPLFCEKCGDLLPRPYVEKNGEKKLMSGFTSAYKRMRWDLPASTLTTNLQYPSSDHKIHPDQNRVLSLYEAFLLHSLNEFDFKWVLEDGKKAKTTTITEVIGESIPPLGLKVIFKNLVDNIKK